MLMDAQEMSDHKHSVHHARLSWSNLPSVLLAFSLSWLTNDVQSLARTTSTCKRWLTDHRVDRLFEPVLKQKLHDREDPLSLVDHLGGEDGKCWRKRCSRYCQTLQNLWRVDINRARVGTIESSSTAFHLERASDILWLGSPIGNVEARDLNTGKQIFEMDAGSKTYVDLLAVNDERTVLVTLSDGELSVWQYMTKKLLFSSAAASAHAIDFWSDRYILLTGTWQLQLFSFNGDKQSTFALVQHNIWLPDEYRLAHAAFQSETEVVFCRTGGDYFSLTVSETTLSATAHRVPRNECLTRGCFFGSWNSSHSLSAKFYRETRRLPDECQVLGGDRTGVLLIAISGGLRAAQLSSTPLHLGIAERVRQVDLLRDSVSEAQRNWRYVIASSLSCPPFAPPPGCKMTLSVLDFSGRRLGPPREPGALWSLVEDDAVPASESASAAAAATATKRSRKDAG